MVDQGMDETARVGRSRIQTSAMNLKKKD